MGRRQVRGFSRHQDEAELFFASLTGIAPRSNAGRRPRAGWNAEQFFAEFAGESTESFETSPAAFRAPGPHRAPPSVRRPRDLAEPPAPPAAVVPYGDEPMFSAPVEEMPPEPAARVILDGPEDDPPLDLPYPSDERGEAVDVTPAEADESPLSFDKLLAIDTSQMVDSWDDRSSAT